MRNIVLQYLSLLKIYWHEITFLFALKFLRTNTELQKEIVFFPQVILHLFLSVCIIHMVAACINYHILKIFFYVSGA